VAKPEGPHHIVIGTAGRIADMARKRLLDLRQVRLFAADEADRLLEEPRNDLRLVQRYCSHIVNKKAATYQHDTHISILGYSHVSKQ
jgi:superfamily II DNA/RNA helicase